MTVYELILQLQEIAGDDDPEVILFDRRTNGEWHVNPDADLFGYEILRGDGQVVIEFETDG